MTSYRRERAFTLVELLVVITIIGILIALLLPAVQAAREAARQTQCRNNLKQMALAVHSHVLRYGFFPSGGVNDWNVGDPSTGPGAKQHAAWTYIILPFMEQQNLYEATPAVRVTTPLAWIHCPSRRRAVLYTNWRNRAYSGVTPPNLVRNDYAACAGGDVSNLEDAGNRNAYTKGTRGVCYRSSEVREAKILDGLSNTYLIGEKSVNSNFYYTGQSGGDDDSMYNGSNWDTLRTAYKTGKLTSDPPSGDYATFGSAHMGGFYIAFCDGSVHMIPYTIDAETHARLGSIDDQLPIDQAGY